METESTCVNITLNARFSGTTKEMDRAAMSRIIEENVRALRAKMESPRLIIVPFQEANGRFDGDFPSYILHERVP